MAVEGSAENQDPHLISFINPQLGVEIQARFDHSAMEKLTTDERTLLERVQRAQTLALALALMVKDEMASSPHTDWKGYLERMVKEADETISDLEGEQFEGSLVARVLGIDLSPSKEALHA